MYAYDDGSHRFWCRSGTQDGCAALFARAARGSRVHSLLLEAFPGSTQGCSLGFAVPLVPCITEQLRLTKHRKGASRTLRFYGSGGGGHAQPARGVARERVAAAAVVIINGGSRLLQPMTQPMTTGSTTFACVVVSRGSAMAPRRPAADRSISSLNADKMDTIAYRCKRNSRTIDRISTSSVQECTAEAGQGVTSNAVRKRLESAKSECKTTHVKAISSKGTRPDAMLEATNVFVEKISSTYTDEEVDQVKTFRQEEGVR
ncbi:unnamed protein product [Ectocarpus sp. CCAP 1310/34]|nr:unnamed protein product [Ectocarpus sp. CCAP 1310/34]